MGRRAGGLGLKKEASREKCGPGSEAKIGKSKRLVKTIYHGEGGCFV